MALNLNNLRTPGVYVDEVSVLPPNVAPVETAVAAFVGYTARNPDGVNIPKQITSFLEYRQFFGGPPAVGAGQGEMNLSITVTDTFPTTADPDPAYVAADRISRSMEAASTTMRPTHNMYFAVRHYFDNGGGKCYIVSVGDYSGVLLDGALTAGIDSLEQQDEPTLIVIPEAHSLPDAGYNNVYTRALNQCEDLMDRFTIIDVRQGADRRTPSEAMTDITNFQSTSNLGDYGRYGAAYYPYLETTVDFEIGDPDAANITITHVRRMEDGTVSPDDAGEFTTLAAVSGDLLKKQMMGAINNMSIILPPSPAMAGIYSRVDNDRGVWKAPANVSVGSIVGPMVKITNSIQDVMNIDPNAGKSVNAIRNFTGRGTLVWGARTLAGNDNEWRYVPVRRFFNFVEESVKKASVQFVFEPNDANTWVKIRGMVENFLRLQWSQGALMGAKPEEAFFVKIGLGQTMTQDDINNGRMIVEIGMAAVRPAEFIILRFMHHFPEA